VAASARAAQPALIADTHVNSALPTTNSGAISNLDVGGGYTALLQFDLSMLPSGTSASQVSRAVLRLYCNRVTTAGLVTFAPINAAWGEYSVTYATEPAIGSAAGVFSVTQAGAYVAVDVTSLVQSWITTPSSNHGLALSAGTASVQFDSKENDQTAHTAMLDVELVDQGPTGATGATGAPGLAGPQGPTGLTGPAGQTGAQGIQGGKGDAGPQGPAGPVGLSYQGTYVSTIRYALGDGVRYNGAAYISLRASNIGNTPGQSPTWWSLFAEDGATGATGPTGATGTIGPAGPTGAQGPTGATGATGTIGPSGLTYKGVWSNDTGYVATDSVTYNGSTYIAVNANISERPDNDPGNWSLIAAAGATGAAGPAGANGATGATGPTGANGTNGTTGATGSAGAVGMTFLGPWVSGRGYNATNAVTYNGSTYIATAFTNSTLTPDNNSVAWSVLAQGSVGPAGATGPSGVAATVSIGTTTTGAAGSSASVTNTGTTSAAVLNFTIPQGAASTGGGSSGISGVAVYHSVYSGSPLFLTYYSVSNSMATYHESDSAELYLSSTSSSIASNLLAPYAVLTWVSATCATPTLHVYSMQSGTITVTLRYGSTPKSLASSADLTVTVPTGSSDFATGIETIPAGDFVDYYITGASTNPAAVWTSLTCN